MDFALHDEARPGKPKQYEADVEAQIAALACSAPPQDEDDQPGDDPAGPKKNLPKPWRRVMWCTGELTEEYRRRMYELLALYARPYDPTEPVICMDEKSKQLLRETRCPLPGKPGVPLRQRVGGREYDVRHRRSAEIVRSAPGSRILTPPLWHGASGREHDQPAHQRSRSLGGRTG